MSRFACASLLAVAAASGDGGDGGDYQKKYMKGGQGGDYEKYMKKYTKGQGGDYQKKYMKGQGGDYQKYMSGGQKVDAISMAAGACDTMECLEAWHDKQKTQLNFIPQAYQDKPLKKLQDTYDTNKARIQVVPPVSLVNAIGVTTDDTVAKSAEPVALFAEAGDIISAKAISMAASCTTMECIQAWRQSQEKEIQKYVPKEYQSKASKNIEAHFEKVKARIEGGIPAEALSLADASIAPSFSAASEASSADAVGLPAAAILLADSCTTMECLNAWREKQEKEVEKYVPKEYLSKASTHIEAHFVKSKARIENGGVPASPVALLVEAMEPVVLTADIINLAAVCTSVACLDDWRAKQEKRIDEYVPKHWQSKAMKDVESHYAQQKARIENGGLVGALHMSTDSASSMSPVMLGLAAGVPSFGAGLLLTYAMRRRGSQDNDPSEYQTVV